MIKILSQQEKHEVEMQLKDQFGIESVLGMIAKMGEERFFIFSGSFSESEVLKLEKVVFIERLGIYFAKVISGENAIKLSMEGVQILKDQIKKNIIELDEKQAESWTKGEDLNVQTGKRGFVILKHKNDFLGCGKASQHKIGNFIPKSRRLRNKSS